MYNFCNLIHKCHYILLENFSHLVEPSNVTKPKYIHVLVSRDQWVKIIPSPLKVEVSSNNLCPCLPKTKPKQPTYFSQTCFQNFSLIGSLVTLFLLFRFLSLFLLFELKNSHTLSWIVTTEFHWILLDNFDSFHHSFNRGYDKV